MEAHVKAVEGSCVRFGDGRYGGASVATVAQNLGVCWHFGATSRFSMAKYPLRRVNKALNGLKDDGRLETVTWIPPLVQDEVPARRGSLLTNRIPGQLYFTTEMQPQRAPTIKSHM